MAKSSERRAGLLDKLRDKLRGRRERRARKAHTRDEAKREWECSGDVGRHGAHEGYERLVLDGVRSRSCRARRRARPRRCRPARATPRPAGR